MCALYALIACMLILPLAIVFYMKSAPDYAENVTSVKWLPETASNISYYKSKQVQVYEFTISADQFRKWAEGKDMTVRRLMNQQVVSRYKAYLPTTQDTKAEALSQNGEIPIENFKACVAIGASINQGLIAKANKTIAIYDDEESAPTSKICSASKRSCIPIDQRNSLRGRFTVGLQLTFPLVYSHNCRHRL